MVIEKNNLGIELQSLLEEDQSLFHQILVKEDILLVHVNILEAHVIPSSKLGFLIETFLNILIHNCKYNVKGKNIGFLLLKYRIKKGKKKIQQVMVFLPTVGWKALD